MKVGTYSSLTDMVKSTPHFGTQELKTFQEAARTIVDEAESVVLCGSSRAQQEAQAAGGDMRDLQEALRAGFPCVLHANGSRELKPKLPMDLYDTLAKVNDTMPLYLSLTMCNVPAAVADTVVMPRDGQGNMTLTRISPTERALEKLEDIRNSIAQALVPEDK